MALAPPVVFGCCRRILPILALDSSVVQRRICSRLIPNDLLSSSRFTRYLSTNFSGIAESTNTTCTSGTTSFSRKYTTDKSRTGMLFDRSNDPYKLVQNDLDALASDIRQELKTNLGELSEISQYHFDGGGKYFRPLIIMLMARACNVDNRVLLPTQRKVAMIAEMIHTASLIHDDVIDASNMRRGKETVQKSWGQRKAILVGDYILSVASMILAQIGNVEVVEILSQVLEDLVSGEFMQLGSKEDENERFGHYLKKTFKKTASLIAKSCKAVAILGNCSDSEREIAFEYGRNIGIAFQLVDDLLDFISTESIMGKPASADLKLGLATGPVLYAAHQFPEINAMIMRRFAEPGDVQLTLQLVAKSDGVSHTRFLAEQHSREAVRQVLQLNDSPERQALMNITEKVINRIK